MPMLADKWFATRMLCVAALLTALSVTSVLAAEQTFDACRGDNIEPQTKDRLVRGTAAALQLESRVVHGKLPDAPDTIRAATSQRFAIVASPDAGAYLPGEKATQTLELYVVADSENAYLSVAAYVTRRPTTSNPPAPPVEVFCFASAVSANRHTLLIPSWFSGTIEVAREDVDTDAVTGRVLLQAQPFQAVAAAPANFLDQAFAKIFTLITRRSGNGEKVPWFDGTAAGGYAVKRTLTAPAYDTLVDYARCDYLNSAERGSGGCVEKSMTSAAAIHQFVSESIGRNTATELASNLGPLRAGESEPIVVFFGLAGLNRILLLDCRASAARGPAQSAVCTRYAEPWQISLQQADYIWVVYIEDDRSPFDTSIDVEYRQHRPDIEYDEFDAETELTRRGGVGNAAADSSNRPPRVLRIAAKRLRIRDAPTTVVTAFTRRGPNYGVRQWQKGFIKSSDHWWAIAGTALIGAKGSRSETLRIAPEPSADPGLPRYARLVVDDNESWGYVGVALRWPGRRARVTDYSGVFKQFVANLVPPDIAVGMAPRKGNGPYVAVLSWPVFFDRLHIFFGLDFDERIHFKDGFAATQLVAAGTKWEEVATSHLERNGVMYGITFDVVRTK